jgi:hypothetical protein
MERKGKKRKGGGRVREEIIRKKQVKEWMWKTHCRET